MRILGRSVGVLVAAASALLCAASPAAADDGSSFSWVGVVDSHGVPIWAYSNLSLDGGGITDPDKFVWGFLVNLVWMMYQGWVMLACWLIDWTLSFEWLSWIATPVIAIGDNIQAMVDRLGATPALLTVAALFAVLLMARGRLATGVFDLFMACLVAALATGWLANPVRQVAGPGGFLMDTRDAALQLAVGVAGDDTTGTDAEMRARVIAVVADTFIRTPHQLINYGKVLDGTKCEDVYTKSLTTPSKNAVEGAVSAIPGVDVGPEEPYELVGECDKAAGDYASSAGPAMLLSASTIGPSGSLAVVFAAVLCFGVLLSGVFVLFQAVKLILALVFALLHSSRGSLWMTIASLVMDLVAMAFAVVFLVVYLLFIQSTFTTDDNPVETFFVIDLMLLAGLIVYWTCRRRIKRAAAALAAALSTRPGAGASRLPAKQGISAAEMYYKGKMAYSGVKYAGALAGAAAGRVPSLPRWQRKEKPAPPGKDLVLASSHTPVVQAGGDSLADKLRRRGARVASSRAATVVFVGATGGAGAAAKSASGRLAATAGRKAVEAKLRRALPAGRGSGTPSALSGPSRSRGAIPLGAAPTVREVPTITTLGQKG